MMMMMMIMTIMNWSFAERKVRECRVTNNNSPFLLFVCFVAMPVNVPRKKETQISVISSIKLGRL